ncbi:restriction endonuclease subunit S [Phascolarctobacterium succinatutens]|uniref:restriction endonuclease subunit S n=3 Tax=Phascolarctobacterium succinatutens TaxID=626940 RepID=UPI00307A7703
MSNLEELIERLCPDGVEYKRLGDIGRISMCKRVLKSQTNSVSGVPFYKIGTFGKEADSYISEELFLDYKSRYPYPKKGDVLISASGTIGRTVIFDGKPSYFQDSNIIWVANNEEFLTNKFLYYIYQTNPWKVADGGTIQRLYNSDLEKIQLPVPPLEVQREIVRILDNFAIATTEIQQKLQEELAARQKQYEYYRDFLLTFKSNESTILNERTNELELSGAIRWMKLGDICDVRDGTHDSPKQTLNGKYLITSKNIKNGTIDYAGSYFISNEDFDKINLRSKVEINDILFTMIGTIGEIGLVKNEPDYAIKNVGLIKTNNELLSRFLKHYLKSKQVKKYIDNNKSQGSQSFLALGKLRNIPIPILKTQRIETIVDILDRFDALCNDITSGLPAEIEARQKQYEYYRDKLLTFKELKKEA